MNYLFVSNELFILLNIIILHAIKVFKIVSLCIFIIIEILFI